MLNKLQTTTLSNGLTVLSVTDPGAESVAVGIWIRVGGRYESALNSGYSHFLEHMLFKGTPSRTPLDITRAIEGCGGYINAYTQEESTCYYARLPCEFVEDGVDVLSDMYMNALLSDEEIEREREVILEEIKMYHDLPHHLAQEKLQEVMFKNHALGRPLAGSDNTLQPVCRDALREFKNSFYKPGSTVLAFAGRIDHDQCVKMVESRLGDLPRGEGGRYSELKRSHGQDALVLTGKNINQVHALLGFRVFGRHDQRRYALRVMNGLLGENMSSRLFQSVRERHGLCYSIQSGYQLFNDCGMFSISAGFDSQRAHAALKLTVQELKALIDKGIDQEEFNRAKKYLQGNFRLGFESTGSKMSFIGDSYISYRHARSPLEVLEGIDAVKIDDIRSLAANIFNSENMTLSVVAPLELSCDQARWLESVRF